MDGFFFVACFCTVYQFMITVHDCVQISISLVELRVAQENSELGHKSIVPVASPSNQSGESEKDEVSTIKAGLRKVKILTEYVSTRKSRKPSREEEGSEGNYSARSEDGEYNYPFDSDSLDDFEEGDSHSEEVKEDSSVRKSFSYGKLAFANAGGSFYSSMRVKGDDEDWVYYSNHKSDVGSLPKEDSIVSSSEPYVAQSSRRSLLPWRKRKLSFRSPKSKGEPLLKKAYGEEGGDDIDFDRRQLSSDESISFGVKTCSFSLFFVIYIFMAQENRVLVILKIHLNVNLVSDLTHVITRF